MPGPFVPSGSGNTPRVDLGADGPTQVNQAWDYLRGYWNVTAPIQALNLGILTAAINVVR
jgi:hypothetical protein